jgi:hypothetical protein
MAELDDDFFKAGTSFKRPIPGQSLTDDPAAPRPFEGPPKFTDRNDVLEYYFELLTAEDTYESVLNSLEEGASLMEIVQVLIMQGFQDGLYNPDMMLMIAEPLAYMVAALAERAGVDFTVMGDEDEKPTTEEDELPIMNQAVQSIQKPEMDEDFPSGVAQKLDQVEPPKQRSLLGER